MKCKLCGAVLNPDSPKKFDPNDYVGHRCFNGDVHNVKLEFEKPEP